MLELDPQRAFSVKQKARLFHLAEGRCQVGGCGNKIRGAWIAGHYPVPHNFGGRTVIENGRVEGQCCSPKTHKEDTKTAAKAKRQALETGQQARRKRNKSQWGIPGLKKQIGTGKVVKRD